MADCGPCPPTSCGSRGAVEAPDASIAGRATGESPSFREISCQRLSATQWLPVEPSARSGHRVDARAGLRPLSPWAGSTERGAPAELRHVFLPESSAPEADSPSRRGPRVGVHPEHRVPACSNGSELYSVLWTIRCARPDLNVV